MVKAKKWVIAKMFEGEAKDSNFRLEEEELPSPKTGEFICVGIYHDVDSYVRLKNPQVNEPIYGAVIARVTESKNKEYPEGCLVSMKSGWRTHTLVTPENLAEMEVWKPSDMGTVGPLTASGPLGETGMAAYFGFLELCQPKEGEVVLVNGAAGAVGSVVGQIAKIKGCKVIGSAGTKEKCDWLTSLGFDHVFNYKEVDVNKALNEAAPDGIDCYFDTVGGVFSAKVAMHMKVFGRMSLCGATSVYNDDLRKPGAPFPLLAIIWKQVRVEGFSASRWRHRFPEARAQILKWINMGTIQFKETIHDGFDQMPTALMDLLKGGNIGKMVVKA